MATAFGDPVNQIVEVGQLVKVPAGTFADCVKTKEWSPLASRVENKWYCGVWAW
jgi:hypothetical protein